MNCPFCKATPTEVRADNRPFIADEGTVGLGLSPLHFGPRALDWFWNMGLRKGSVFC